MSKAAEDTGFIIQCNLKLFSVQANKNSQRAMVELYIWISCDYAIIINLLQPFDDLETVFHSFEACPLSPASVQTLHTGHCRTCFCFVPNPAPCCLRPKNTLLMMLTFSTWLYFFSSSPWTGFFCVLWAKVHYTSSWMFRCSPYKKIIGRISIKAFKALKIKQSYGLCAKNHFIEGQN